MSYRLFAQGFSSDEIQRIKAEEGSRDLSKERLKRWSDSEHARKLSQQIRESQEMLKKLELQVWRKMTGRRSIPANCRETFNPRREQ